VTGRHHRAFRIVEYLGRGGPKEHVPESASVRRHDKEIEFACSRDLGDLSRRFTRRKLRFEKRIEFALGNAQCSPSISGRVRT
jgi:hypothetical protein